MDNEQYWIFSFGSGQQYEGYYVKIFGTFRSAREEMFRRFGKHWSMQYTEQEWESWCKEARQCGIPIEKELK